jgi:mono/diheme cytochrome c family protein
MFRARAALGLLVMGTLLSGCTRIEQAMASVSFLDFMHSSPAFDPMEATRPAPEHAVPYATGTGDPWMPPIEASEVALNAFGDTAVNPLPMDSATLARGEEVFNTFCFVCHGTTGVGNGPAIGQGKLPYAANLMLPITVNRTDGYIYGVIRSGRGLMPNYKRIPSHDRWAVVNYVRELQRQAQADSAGGQ